jgi:hypothetical protein
MMSFMSVIRLLLLAAAGFGACVAKTRRRFEDALTAFAFRYTYLMGSGTEKVKESPVASSSSGGKICYTIEGYSGFLCCAAVSTRLTRRSSDGCGFFERAKAMGLRMNKEDDQFKVTVKGAAERSEYVGKRLPELNKVVEGGPGNHRRVTER